jgi:hypothetical protein
MTDTQQPPATTNTRSQTTYIILRFTGEGGDQLPPKYELVGRKVHAHNADDAIRRFVEGAKTKDDGGLFVAIAEARWKPQRVTVEQTVVVRVGDA